MNLDIPYFSLLLLAAFVLKHNIDEKKKRKKNSRKTRIAEDRMLV